MLELVCRTQEVSPVEALQQLAEVTSLPDLCLDDQAVARAEEHYGARRHLVDQLWDRASARLLSPPPENIRRIQQECLIRPKGSRSRIQAGPARLMGITSDDELERTFHPGSYAYYNRNHVGTAAPQIHRHRHLLKGRGWDNVLVGPAYDLPGRICGLHCLGREGRWPQDHAFLPLSVYGKQMVGHNRNREAGLTGLTTALEDQTSPYIIAVDNWLVSLRLQILHFNLARRPMPVVSWYENGTIRTERAWQALDRPVIFWSTKITPQLVRQLMITDGLLCLVNDDQATTWEGLDKRLRKKGGMEFARQIQDNARPWHKVVGRWMAHNTKARDDLIRDMEENGDDLSYLYRCIDSGHKPVHRTRRMAPFHNQTVLEQGDCWYRLDKHGKPAGRLTNGLVRIYYMIRDSNRDVMFYRGEILIDGRSVPFMEPVEDMDARPYQVLKQVVADTGLPKMFWVEHGWAGRLIDMAAVFHEPVSVLDDITTWLKAFRRGELKPHNAQNPYAKRGYGTSMTATGKGKRQTYRCAGHVGRR